MKAIEHAQETLQTVIADLNRELAEYPTPVSGCDQQYAYLLACRQRARNALNALETDVFVATPRTLSPGAGVESR